MEQLEARELLAASLVTNLNLNGASGWGVLNTNTASSRFENGPDTPPLGQGSFRTLTGSGSGTDAGGKVFLGTALYDGLRLDALAGLSYSTYITSAQSSNLAPYLNLYLDLNNDDIYDTDVDDLLVFDPIYNEDQQELEPGVWQTWDAAAGRWWGFHGNAAGQPPSGAKTFAEILQTYPDAKIIGPFSGPAGLRVVVGQASGGIWANFDGSIDNVVINDGSGSTTFDFEWASAGPVPVLVPGGDGDNCEVGAMGTAAGVGNHQPSSYGEAPVRYADGVVRLTMGDLFSAGFGTPWGQSRSWTNGPGYADGGGNGSGVVDAQLPHLVRANGDATLAVVTDGSTAYYFDLVLGAYRARFFNQEQLTYDGGAGEFVFIDTVGNQFRFHDFSASLPESQRGRLASHTDPFGNVITVTYDDGKVSAVERSDDSGAETVTESYFYSYVAGGANDGLLASVSLERRIGAGPYQVVREVVYSYYDGVEANGSAGDLKTAEVRDADENVLDTHYYRYYVAEEQGGYEHGLKLAFSPQSFARLAAAYADPFAASDAEAAPYADLLLAYDGQQRVSEVVVQGTGCSSCTGGLGTYSYSYMASDHADGLNNWRMMTVETLPDGNQNIVYTNSYGQVMLQVFRDLTTEDEWANFTRYDAQGRVVLMANPSAVTGYDDELPDLLGWDGDDFQYLADDAGLISLFTYADATTATDTTPGAVAGYEEKVEIQRGDQGTPILQSSQEYLVRAAGGATVFPMATFTVYRNEDGTGAQTTAYDYTWFTDTTRMESMTVSRPVVSAGQNGPGTADVETLFYDLYGRVTWARDGDGFLTHLAYDPATSSLVKVIADVDTTRTNDFADLPAGWETPAGGGLHLVTLREVDGLGRETVLTDPNGNLTYTVYIDPNYEVRRYGGWDSVGGRPTGPTEVVREDRPGSYFETLTMSAAPDVDGSGRPTGAEAVGDLQSLARTYTNSAGQVSHSDAYFEFSGLTYSTGAGLGEEGEHFNRVRYGYDHRGRPDRVVSPTGTITRMVYDGLGRVVSTWIGTNDTPASGFWSPENNTAPANMVQVTASVYDGGGVGDGNLTQMTEFPGGGADDRVTQYFHDWRNRLVAVKGGVQGSEGLDTQRPITYVEYDNLSQIIASEYYDSDGVSVSDADGNGVPDRPDAALLRALDTMEYDDQGRVFRSHTFSVDQTTGAVSADSLTTDVFYDHRGQVIQVSAPGGLVSKMAYDGAGRLTTSFTSDGGGDVSWSDAGNVTDDNVLEQVERLYDANGNVILVTSRQRFHDETATGALGDPENSPYARVYYTAHYYDAADRLLATVEVGTNAGTAYERPAEVPGRSDTVLVTSYGYHADEVQEVALNGGPTGGSFTLSFGSETTAPIAFDAPAGDVQAALEALATIGAGNVLVMGPAGGPWVVRFAGALAGVPVAEMTGDGSGLTGGESPSVSTSTASQGGDAGRFQEMTDPRGIVGKTDYDLLGRTVRTIEAFADLVPSGADDRTTAFSYDGSSHLLTLTAWVSGSASQVTQYVYGVTTAGGSGVNSNDLLAEVRYPDKVTGQPSSLASDIESYGYNALGQVVTRTDRNGSVHAYTYDVLGRITADAVTTLGAGVDGAVLRLETAYDTAGRPFRFTSYDAASGGNVVNQVERVYNGLSQVIFEYQEHGGAVNTGTTSYVQYTYSEMAGGANHSRLVSMTYPNGRVLHFVYGSGLDDSISRLSQLADDDGMGAPGTVLEEYAYLGLETVVRRAHPEADIELTYIGDPGDAGDPYRGLDRFGRVAEQLWQHISDQMPTDHFAYGYDRNSNRLYRENLIDAAFSELYHDGSGYDLFNQLTTFARGELNGSKDGLVGTPQRTQEWDFDALGNWETVTTDSIQEEREHNAQNQLTEVGASALAFDANGNTTTDEQGRALVYDAWNRLVRVENGETVLVEYRYDAMNWRVQETRDATTTDLFYSNSWQVLEERRGQDTAVQYVWSPVYVDALVLRDRDTDGEEPGLEERLYVQQDANWNVTALVETDGDVAERFVYDPYGAVTVLEADWDPLSSSNYEWVYLHQGGRFDGVVGLYHFRNRDLSPTLGRWVQRDPIELAGGLNLYGYVSNNPTNLTDPFGLQVEASKEQVYQLLVRQCQSMYKAAMEYGSIQNRAQYQKEYEDCLARAKAYRDNPLPIRLPSGGSGSAGRGPTGGTTGGATGCAVNGPGAGALSGRPLVVAKVPPPPGWAAIISVPSDKPPLQDPSFLEILGGTLAHFYPNVAKLPKPDLPSGALAAAGELAIPIGGPLGEIGAGPLAAIGTIATIGALAWMDVWNRILELKMEIASSNMRVCVYGCPDGTIRFHRTAEPRCPKEISTAPPGDPNRMDCKLAGEG